MGIKLSPLFDNNDMSESNPISLMDYMIEELNNREIAFVEVNEGISFLDDRINQEKTAAFFAERSEKSLREIYKKKFKGAWITNYRMS